MGQYTATSTLLALVLALQMADVATTAIILSHGGRELNRIMRWSIAHLGVGVGLVLPKAAVLSWIGYYIAMGQRPNMILGGLCAWYSWAVWHNLGKIRN